MNQFQQRQGTNVENTRASVMNSGLPMGTAMGRALGREMGNVQNQGNIGMLGAGLAANDANMSRRFAAAQGLQGMPGMYGAPGSMELQMLGMQQPYDIARYQGNNQRNMMSSQLQSQFMNNLMGKDYEGFYMEPSKFEQYISPFINPLLEGFGKAIPSAIFGGGG